MLKNRIFSRWFEQLNGSQFKVPLFVKAFTVKTEQRALLSEMKEHFLTNLIIVN